MHCANHLTGPTGSAALPIEEDVIREGRNPHRALDPGMVSKNLAPTIVGGLFRQNKVLCPPGRGFVRLIHKPDRTANREDKVNVREMQEVTR